MTKKKPPQFYEVKIPVRETWVFTVRASSQAEAIALVNKGYGHQTCSVGGWPIGRRGTPTEKPVAKMLQSSGNNSPDHGNKKL